MHVDQIPCLTAGLGDSHYQIIFPPAPLQRLGGWWMFDLSIYICTCNVTKVLKSTATIRLDTVFLRPHQYFLIAFKVILSLSGCHKIFRTNKIWIVKVCQNVVLGKINITMTMINKNLWNQVKMNFAASRPAIENQKQKLQNYRSCKVTEVTKLQELQSYRSYNVTEVARPHFRWSSAKVVVR